MTLGLRRNKRIKPHVRKGQRRRIRTACNVSASTPIGDIGTADIDLRREGPEGDTRSRLCMGERAMTTAAEYRRYAQECIDSPEQPHPTTRKQFLDIAKLWMTAADKMDAAEHRAANIKAE
jgi:hypothetical protein